MFCWSLLARYTKEDFEHFVVHRVWSPVMVTVILDSVCWLRRWRLRTAARPPSLAWRVAPPLGCRLLWVSCWLNGDAGLPQIPLADIVDAIHALRRGGGAKILIRVS